MKAVLYNCMLRCMHVGGGVRYELPAHYINKVQNYFLYYRPEPLVHHRSKQKDFYLAHPEVILVGDHNTYHCISIGLSSQRQIRDLYININLPPKAHEKGHEWEDLELDVKAAVDVLGKWKLQVVDLDDFVDSSLTDQHRHMAWQEVIALVEKIRTHQFPFGPHLQQILQEIVP